MKIQLLYFAGCPNIDLARSTIASALEDFPNAVFEEFDVACASTPTGFRDWGSPTILVDDQDVAGAQPSGRGCRLYDEHHPASRGVPAESVIRRALAKARAQQGRVCT